MLNKDNERELAYVARIDEILPHPNADRLEIAVVNGWRVIVGLNEFKAGDLAIYCEIDSKLPEIKPWTDMEFLASKHFKIKTVKLRGEISQGFLASLDLFDWGKDVKEGDFLTKKLGITYVVAEDNKRKGSGSDKYKAMAQRHPKQAKTWWWRWLWKSNFGKKLLFLVFGRKSDKKKDWPYFTPHTNEERIQNCLWVLDEDVKWVASEKLDGTSTTFAIERGKKTLFGNKPNKFYVCSRNVVFDTPEKMDRCYYEQNYYTQMAEKYNAREVLEGLLEANPDWNWIVIQGETFGKGIQKNTYDMGDVDFRVFNLIDSVNGRWGSTVGKAFLESHTNFKWVPLLGKMVLPKTLDELMAIVDGEPSVINNKMREGIVFRTLDGQKSFKCVSNEYLLKYHS